LLQLLLGIFVMRTEIGYHLFKFLGDKMQDFLSYTDFGTKLVFSENYEQHFFLFKVNF
jgi:nucleoside permease NupC